MKNYGFALGVSLVLFAAALRALLAAYDALSASPPNQASVTLSD